MTNTVNEGLGEYATLLPSHVGTTARPEAGWNSWYELWDEVDEAAIRENATIVAEQFRRRVPEGHLPLRIVIDDGWQNGWGDWTANEKFPSGLAALSNELTEQGFNTGIWLAPLLVHARLPLVAEHPDWFVRDTVFNHLRHGEMKILDVTHPGAADHLRGIVRDLVNAGFTQLKIDFLFPGTYEGGRFDPVTGMQAYNRALQIIRETAGRDTVILGVGSPPIAGFDQVDAWRLGPDIAVAVFGASWFFVPNVGRAVAARWPYCRAVLCDGDPALLRTLPQNETAVGAWSAAFAGSALYLSDDLRDLPRERLDWLTAPLIATALAGGPSIPDPVPLEVPETLTTALSDQVSMQARHQVPSHWTLPSGEKVLINWTDHPQELDGTLYPGRSATLVTP